MSDRNHRACPVELAGMLDLRFRRWVQNPRKILEPYIVEGMTVLDVGCGPGFFTMDMAHMVGKHGRVIAADVQEGMLQKLRRKVSGTELEHRITLHPCAENHMGITAHVDFVLAFYVVHELPSQEIFFKEIEGILKPNGKVLVVEPPFHVSKRAFAETIRTAEAAGLTPTIGPKVFFSRTAILRNSTFMDVAFSRMTQNL